MIRSRIAQRYARALFELARDADRVDEIGNDLATLQEVVVGDPALQNALLSPVLTRAQKSQLVEILLEAAKVDPLVANFLRVLLEARKLPLLGDMITVYGQLADEAAGRVKGEALTLAPLNKPDLDKLAKSLSKALGKDVELTSRLDPTLLGGVVVRVGNLVFDSSIRTQLLRMKDTLIKG